MTGLTIPPILPAASPVATGGAKTRDAAQQFEALLLAQILRSVRESGSGLGKTEESADCTPDFAEQQFARVLAQQGGLGLAALIAAGLEKKPADPLPVNTPR
jgi:Rod binding domain-containing protein